MVAHYGDFSLVACCLHGLGWEAYINIESEIEITLGFIKTVYYVSIAGIFHTFITGLW